MKCSLKMSHSMYHTLLTTNLTGKHALSLCLHFREINELKISDKSFDDEMFEAGRQDLMTIDLIQR